MYLALKHLHVTCVVLSVCGFVLRFALTAHGSAVVQRRFARTAPHVIDTVLLAAAIGMLVVGNIDPLEQPWLLAKIAGLLAYIVLGVFALRRAKSPAGRMAAFVGALASFAFVVSAALTKSAWGVLALLR
mgnify:CR=1 FL=1